MDVSVRTPVSNRDRAEFEKLVGCFVNMLVLRTDLSDDPTFTALLAQVRDTTLAGLSHRELPFDRIVAELQPVRTLDRNPLFKSSSRSRNIGLRACVSTCTTWRFCPSSWWNRLLASTFSSTFGWRKNDSTESASKPRPFQHSTMEQLAEELSAAS